jgi:hypothetical protein
MCYRCSFCSAVVPPGTPRTVHVTYRSSGPLKGTILREYPACRGCAIVMATRQASPPGAPPQGPHVLSQSKPPAQRGAGDRFSVGRGYVAAPGIASMLRAGRTETLPRPNGNHRRK